MLEKINHTVVPRPMITSDIEPREPEILGRREGETEPRRHAHCDGTIIIRLLRVHVGFDVATGAPVPIPVPCATYITSFFAKPNISEARFL